jgi:hypothetical protein
MILLVLPTKFYWQLERSDTGCVRCSLYANGG